MDEHAGVVGHYGAPGVAGRLLGALEAKGVDLSRLTAADLRGMDQLHGGGFAATEAMAELAGLREGLRALDAGCGVGGSSRYLAERGCEVEAIDLTPEFVEAAEELNRRCGLGDRIRTRVGSVTALPYPDASFDLVWSHYVAMNVADKAGLFREAFRVLRPGGRLAFAVLAQGPEGEPHYPLPFARDPGLSFLPTPEEVEAGLRAAGFEVLAARRPTPGPPGMLPAQGGDRGLAPKVEAMGADMAEREANAGRSVREGRLLPLTVLAARPG